MSTAHTSHNGPAPAASNPSAPSTPSNPSCIAGAMPLGTSLSSQAFLRNVLRLDALSCVACGLLQVAFTGALTGWLGLPAALLGYSGEFLLVYAALVAFLSTRRPIPRGVVWLLLIGNLGWTAACVALLMSGEVEPTGMGTAYVLVQAVTVAALAALQYLGLRRSAAS